MKPLQLYVAFRSVSALLTKVAMDDKIVLDFQLLGKALFVQ